MHDPVDSKLILNNVLACTNFAAVAMIARFATAHPRRRFWTNGPLSSDTAQLRGIRPPDPPAVRRGPSSDIEITLFCPFDGSIRLALRVGTQSLRGPAKLL